MVEPRAGGRILAMIAVGAGLAGSVASGCESDGSTNDDAAGTGAATSAPGSGGSGGGTANSSTSGSGGATTECFDWPSGAGGKGGEGAAGAGGGSAGGGMGGARAVPPCPMGADVLMHVSTHLTCATYTCLGYDGGQCCYEIAPWTSCPDNAFPSFSDCP